MNEGRFRIYRQALSLLLVIGSLGYLALELRLNLARLTEAAPAALALLMLGAATAFLATARSGKRTIRLSPTFIIAALLLLPPPVGLAVALAALAAGRGAGVAGPSGGGLSSFAAVASAAACAQWLHRVIARDVETESLFALGCAALAYAIVQSAAYAISMLLAPGTGGLSRKRIGEERGAALLETLNVPAAWVVAGLLARDFWLQAGVISALLLAGQFALMRLSSAIGKLNASKRSLASRMSELETLHSIGLEVLSSMDPDRLFAAIERECRKIIDVDFFLIALDDPEGGRLEAVYRRRGDAVAQTKPVQLEVGVARSAVNEKRGLRVDDFHDLPDGSPLRAGGIGSADRSAMAVPLLVQEKAIGVLAVHAAEPEAYDDHQLAVLTTIAQQAAVAIENVRHYQRATVDSMTGFLLRDPFFKRLDDEYRRAARYGGRFALLMLDLDRFKEINDNNGHPAGDRYLHSVGSAIREELRAADLACRYGGDEFCLLLPETEIAGAEAIAERIRAAVARHIVAVDGLVLRTTVSVGVAAFPDHGAAGGRDLVRLADEALYKAKGAGRDRVVVSDVRA